MMNRWLDWLVMTRLFEAITWLLRPYERLRERQMRIVMRQVFGEDQ